MHGNPGPGRDFHFRSDTDIHLSTVSSDGESRFHARGFALQKRPISRSRVRQPGTYPVRDPLRDLLLELD